MPELASGSARGLLLVQLCFKSDSVCLSWHRVNHADRNTDHIRLHR